ncbi:hypothetical protein niasHS_009041 [Heterodera schachtii]|uniref:Uncharacterized protein n=1 Tax=Heterodera schachtii TaxID=97005 RepID=A0ABD2J1M0_HETSC
MRAVVQSDNAKERHSLSLPTQHQKQPLFQQKIAQQDVFGTVDGGKLVAFVRKTNQSGETAVLMVDALSFLCRLHHFQPDNLLMGTLPTVDNHDDMAHECLQMDDGTHSQQTKHSRAKEVIDRLGLVGTCCHAFAGSNKWNFGSALVVSVFNGVLHAVMPGGLIACAINASLDLCFDRVMLMVDGRNPIILEPNKLLVWPIVRVDNPWTEICDSDIVWFQFDWSLSEQKNDLT